MAAALEAAKELAQATSELDMIKSLTPGPSSGPSGPDSCRGGTSISSSTGHGHLGQVLNESTYGGHRRQGQRQASKMAKTSKQRESAGPRQRSIAEFLKVGKLVELEGSRQGQQERLEPAQAASRHADNSGDSGPQTGASVDDKSPGCQLHHLQQDGCDAQPGGDIIQHWSELETGHNYESREPETPLESHLVSAHDDVHDCGPGEHAFGYPEDRTGQSLGVDSGRPLHRSEMECGEEDARGGRQDSYDPDPANPEPHPRGNQAVRRAIRV